MSKKSFLQLLIISALIGAELNALTFDSSRNANASITNLTDKPLYIGWEFDQWNVSKLEPLASGGLRIKFPNHILVYPTSKANGSALWIDFKDQNKTEVYRCTVTNGKADETKERMDDILSTHVNISSDPIRIDLKVTKNSN